MLRENDWKESRSLVVESIEEERDTVVDAEECEHSLHVCTCCLPSSSELNIWVEQLSFKFPIPPREAQLNSLIGGYPRLEFQEHRLRYSSRFESCSPAVVWSNLTSLKFKNCIVDHHLLAETLGPCRSLRRTIVSLRCNSTLPYSLLFLLEAAHVLKSIEDMLIAPVKTGVDYPIDENSSELEVWERHAEGHFDRDAWGVEPLPENSIIKARFDVDVWQDSFDISPLWEIEDRSLASIIHSSQPSEYPFSSLSSVSLGINLKVEVLLIFYTRLFPSLLFLTLVAHDFFGSLDSLDHATFRYSITR